MAKKSKQPRKKQETAPKIPENTKPDEYANLKNDFAQIIDRGIKSFQEKTPGREVNNLTLRLQGRYGMVVKTTDRGLIEMPEMSGIETDNQGQTKIQRFFLGLNCGAATKDVAFQSVDLLRPGETTAKEFEVNAAAYELLKKTITKAQEEGERLQRRIEEEEEEHWDRFTDGKGQKLSVNHDVSGFPPADRMFNLVSLARQTLKKELGAKLKECQLMAFFTADTQELADSKGNKIDTVVPRTGFGIQAVTNKNNQVFDVIRGTGGIEALMRYDKDKTPEEAVELLAQRVAKHCVDMDRAQPSSSLGSECHVIFGPQATGVLIHEIYGHVLESDIVIDNRRDKDVDLNLKSRIGGQISENSDFSIIDDGNFTVQLGKKTFTNCYGALVADDDGAPAQRTVTVEDGIQVGVLSSADTLNEILHNLPDDIKERIEQNGLTGNLRSQRFDKEPMVRMTNTFALPNEKGPDSIEKLAAMIPKTKKGLYLATVSGGWIDTDSGEFQITGQLGYLIENGVVTDKPIKNALIRGNITKFGSKIKAVGSSKTITETFTGVCGKSGSYVPVEAGGPAVLVEDAELTRDISSWHWVESCQEYIKQLEEVTAGQRKRSEIYFRFVEDATEGKVRDYSQICLVTSDLPIDDEIKMLLGDELTHADFILGEHGDLDEQE